MLPGQGKYLGTCAVVANEKFRERPVRLNIISQCLSDILERQELVEPADVGWSVRSGASLKKWHYSGIAGSSFLTDPDKARTTKRRHFLSFSKKRAVVWLLRHWSSVKKSHLSATDPLNRSQSSL
jgi:hypothetical protein